MIIRPALFAALVCAIGFNAQAQERAAGGTLDTQMTWSALAAKVKTADDKATAAHTRLDQLEKCGKDGKFYAPGVTGADTKTGCIANTESSMQMVDNGGWQTGLKNQELHCPGKLKFVNVMGNLTTNRNQPACSLTQFGCDHSRSDCIGKNKCLPMGADWGGKYYSAWGVCI